METLELVYQQIAPMLYLFFRTSYFRWLQNNPVSTWNKKQVPRKSRDQKYGSFTPVTVWIKLLPRTQLRFLQLRANKQWQAIVLFKQSHPFGSIQQRFGDQRRSHLPTRFGKKQTSASFFFLLSLTNCLYIFSVAINTSLSSTMSIWWTVSKA